VGAALSTARRDSPQCHEQTEYRSGASGAVVVEKDLSDAGAGCSRAAKCPVLATFFGVG
jgi:hypothetical protein